jgi:hypothetical protein
MEPTSRDRRGTHPAASGDGQIAPISTSPESEAHLRSLVERSRSGIRVRVDGGGDLDVSGHVLGGAGELTLTILDAEDDTQGHTISLHFPSLEEAKQFQQRMVLTGAVVATLVIGGTGLALSQAQSDGGAASGAEATVQAPTQVVDEAAAAGSQAWADPGFGADVSNAVGAPTSGGQAAADESYGEATSNTAEPESGAPRPGPQPK